MNHKRKLHLKKQLACIYTADFFSGLRITDAVWVALLAARGFSLWEIGLAESVFHIVNLLCEVPSGMVADLLGRKKALVSGGVLAVTSNLLMAFAPNLFAICFAMALNALYSTLFSGTSTALLYDSLKQEGCEEEYIQVSANSSQISMLANAIGSMASILNQFLGYVGFYLLNAAFEGASALANMLLAEPIVTESQASRENHPLRALPEQFRQLVRDSGFPGMKVLEFAFDSRDTGSASDYLPHNYPVNSVAYTGTHDNETLVSWYQTVTDAERAMVRDYLYDYATPEEQLYQSMIALILRSAAATCIIPMQDWLGLDNSARINKPSTVGQNWRWRLKKTQLTKKLQKEICQLTARYGRMNWA